MNLRLIPRGLLILGAVALAACGGDEPAGERPVDDAEAARMAETLFNNYEIGGADFEVNAQMTDGAVVQLIGTVDWQRHTGRAEVAVSATADAAVTEVIWSEAVVLERIPALTALTATTGQPSAEWFARPPEIEGRHLDSMIQLVTSLATEQRGNAILIRQEPGTAWLRTDTVRSLDLDVEVDVLRFGELTRYWLAVDDVTLYRFEGNNSVRTRPVLVDLRNHGPRSIEFPPATDVVDSATVADLYTAVIEAAP